MSIQRRELLASTSAVAIAGIAGCSSGNGGNSTDVTVEWNYKEYDRVRFPSQDEGVYFESDEEDQYIGTQFKITNETEESINLQIDVDDFSFPELGLLADGSEDDVSIQAKSESELFESVGSGETIEPTMLYITPPGTSNYSVKRREGASNTYSINQNQDLEIGLTSVDT